jgi:hypothetical protein
MHTRQRSRLGLALAVTAALVLSTRVAGATASLQEPEPQEGTVEITNPLQGDTVRGIVQILGTAFAPEFNHYTLEFGFDPNVDDQWFPVQPPVAQQVQAGPLGVWDTTVVADGIYQLRLRAIRNDGRSDEFVVTSITVANAVPTLLPTIAPTLTITPTSSVPTPGPSPTPLIQQPPTRAPRPTPTPGGPTLTPTPNPNVALTRYDMRVSACRGAGITVFFFALLTIYIVVRRYARVEVRRWWTRIRSEILERLRNLR